MDKHIAASVQWAERIMRGLTPCSGSESWTEPNTKRRCCQRLHEAEHVLFREVWFADGSVPQSSHCHDNVDRWVKENSGTTAVRGWVTNAEFSLTAHSVVRGADGGLFDITPLETKDPRIRAAMCFIRLKSASTQHQCSHWLNSTGQRRCRNVVIPVVPTMFG